MPISKASGQAVAPAAKGDLVVGSATNDAAVLAVGNNGETLVADSSASTGLRWQGNFAAGKNAIINGDFRINQRSFSSTTSNNTFIFDRWRTTLSGTQTFSAQTFTAGTAPVTGYEGINFLQCVTTTGAGTYAQIDQPIEDVRTFANQTVTLSFWAKAASGTPKVAANLMQNFGSGGSSSVTTTLTATTISTSWARYSFVINVPSISGKTIGTGSSLRVWITFANDYEAVIGQQAATIGIWGVQLEAGNTATAFQTATGTLAGELAACKRYYEKSYALVDAPGTAHQLDVVRGSGNAAAKTTGYVNANIVFTVEKRTNPTITIYDHLGASGKCSRGTSGATPTANQTVGTYQIGMNTVGVESSGTQNCEFIVYHYVASAEL